MKKVIQFLFDLIFPPVCVHCKKEGDFLCADCIGSFRLRSIRNIRSTKKEFSYLDGLIYALDYYKNPVITAAIKQFKYKFNQELAVYFSTLILEKLKEVHMIKGRRVVLIPVPLHKKRLKKRGFNQSEVLSQSIQKRRGDIKIEKVLIRSRSTDQQAKLNRKSRQENLKDAFQLKNIDFKPSENTVYFLVDDVCTTGATLESCANALKKAGFNKVYGLVIARAFKK